MSAQVRLELPAKASSAAEANLMEKSEKPLSLAADGRSISLAAGPYEIKTVAVKFAHE
jgi:hypothetical protein